MWAHVTVLPYQDQGNVDSQALLTFRLSQRVRAAFAQLGLCKAVCRHESYGSCGDSNIYEKDLHDIPVQSYHV
jgi:hypothetical protein